MWSDLLTLRFFNYGDHHKSVRTSVKGFPLKQIYLRLGNRHFRSSLTDMMLLSLKTRSLSCGISIWFKLSMLSILFHPIYNHLRVTWISLISLNLIWEMCFRIFYSRLLPTSNYLLQKYSLVTPHSVTQGSSSSKPNFWKSLFTIFEKALPAHTYRRSAKSSSSNSFHILLVFSYDLVFKIIGWFKSLAGSSWRPKSILRLRSFIKE